MKSKIALAVCIVVVVYVTIMAYYFSCIIVYLTVRPGFCAVSNLLLMYIYYCFMCHAITAI